MYTLPQLKFNYNSLEPHIDGRTMEIHYTKHHQNYVNKLNESLKNYPIFYDYKIEDLLSNLNILPAEIRNSVKNNGGGHYNHSFFWEQLTEKTSNSLELNIHKEINSQFGNLDNFKSEFEKQAISLFGSGWTWLAIDSGKLEIINTFNQDSVVPLNKKPLLAIDLWEHAYYLNYQNRRADYIKAFWNIIDWNVIDSRLN